MIINLVASSRYVEFVAEPFIGIAEDLSQISELVEADLLKVCAAQPAKIRVEEHKAAVHTGMYVTMPFSLFVSDGQSQLSVSTTSRMYDRKPAVSRLCEIDSNGIESWLHPRILFAQDYWELFTEEDADTSYGITRVLRRREEVDGELKEFLIEVDSITSEIRRISSFTVNSHGDTAEVLRTMFSDWHFDLDPPDEVFITTPPDCASPVPVAVVKLVSQTID